MNFRLILHISCFGAFVSSFTPCFIQCMERGWATKDSLVETSPMDIDPDCLTERIEQVVDGGIVSDESAEVEAVIDFPVNNMQELGVAIQTLIQLSKNQSPQAKSMSKQFAIKIAKNIEIIYKQNPQTVTEFIQQNRDTLNPEFQEIFDSCLVKCRYKIQRFASCHTCSIYTTLAFFSLVGYFVLQEFYL